MSRMTFVNLPVQDLPKSIEFFSALGFEFSSQFTDENATCMVVSDQACVMLLVRPYFAGFTTRDVVEPGGATEVIIAVSADSRQEVDDLVERALALGGGVAKAPSDEGFMYGRSFHDLDGHAWEVIWMDAAAVQ
jgi:uncharacterized protein